MKQTSSAIIVRHSSGSASGSTSYVFISACPHLLPLLLLLCMWHRAAGEEPQAAVGTAEHRGGDATGRLDSAAERQLTGCSVGSVHSLHNQRIVLDHSSLSRAGLGGAGRAGRSGTGRAQLGAGLGRAGLDSADDGDGAGLGWHDGNNAGLRRAGLFGAGDGDGAGFGGGDSRCSDLSRRSGLSRCSDLGRRSRRNRRRGGADDWSGLSGDLSRHSRRGALASEELQQDGREVEDGAAV